MPRKVATQTLDVLGKPDVAPEKCIGEYVESKQNNENFIKAPAWDSMGDGIEEFFLGARLEHESMMREKADLMEHKEIQATSNASRVRQWMKSHAELQNRFFKVNVFLREFEEKRNAALKRGTAELALHTEIRNECTAVSEVIDELGIFRDTFQATVDEYEPYERVLNDVVEQSPNVNSVKDLINRCDALMLAQVEIDDLNKLKIAELEIMRKRLVAIAREASLQVLGLKNALSSVDRFYAIARTECFKWEKRLEHVKNTIKDGVIGKDRVHDGINHLYKMLCKRGSFYPNLPHEAVGQRLDFIKSEVEILQEVLLACQKNVKHEINEKQGKC